MRRELGPWRAVWVDATPYRAREPVGPETVWPLRFRNRNGDHYMKMAPAETLWEELKGELGL